MAPKANAARVLIPRRVLIEQQRVRDKETLQRNEAKRQRREEERLMMDKAEEALQQRKAEEKEPLELRQMMDNAEEVLQQRTAENKETLDKEKVEADAEQQARRIEYQRELWRRSIAKDRAAEETLNKKKG